MFPLKTLQLARVLACCRVSPSHKGCDGPLGAVFVMQPQVRKRIQSNCQAGDQLVGVEDIFVSIEVHSVILSRNGGQEEEAGIKPQRCFSSRLLLPFPSCMVTLSNSALWTDFFHASPFLCHSAAVLLLTNS